MKDEPRRRSAGARDAVPAPQEARQLGRAASRRMAQAGMHVLPQLIVEAGKPAINAFFVASIRNTNTRLAEGRRETVPDPHNQVSSL